MEKPLVSYVVTTYNLEKFVHRSVNCAFNQTYSPLEIVLSDDCSSDKTFEIMQKMVADYKGPHKIILNRNEKNLGITKHMNKAFLELAHGDIIVVAHGDDVSAPERSEEMCKFLLEHNDVTQVSCSALAVNENGKPYDEYTQRNCKVDSTRFYEFGSGAHIPMPCSAFRKNVMDFFGPLNDKCPTEDDPIGFRCILLGKLAFVPNIFVTYYKHSGSNSSPEKFDKFPLEEIYNQNIIDMNIALSKGLINQEMYDKEKNRLYEAMQIRKLYRNYFSKRTLKSLLELLKCPLINNRRRLSYVREHFEYLIGHHE